MINKKIDKIIDHNFAHVNKSGMGFLTTEINKCKIEIMKLDQSPQQGVSKLDIKRAIAIIDVFITKGKGASHNSLKLIRTVMTPTQSQQVKENIDLKSIEAKIDDALENHPPQPDQVNEEEIDIAVIEYANSLPGKDRFVKLTVNEIWAAACEWYKTRINK